MTETSDCSRAQRILGRARSALPIFTLLAASLVVMKLTPSIAAEGRAIPAPATDEAARQPGSEVAILAAGCFWGVQGVFQHVAGVTNAVSGYAGGEQKTAQYNTVSMGKTGHAESVR